MHQDLKDYVWKETNILLPRTIRFNPWLQGNETLTLQVQHRVFNHLNECNIYTSKKVIYRNQAWQILDYSRLKPIQMYLKAAYYDGRDRENPVILIMVLSSYKFNRTLNSDVEPQLFCSLWSKVSSKPKVLRPLDYINLTGWPFRLDGDGWGGCS